MTLQSVLISDLSGIQVQTLWNSSVLVLLAGLSMSPDLTLLFTTPAWTPNSVLLWIHQRGSSHRIAFMTDVDPAEAQRQQGGRSLSLCPDNSRDTHQDKTALFLLQSPSLSKLSAEALFSPSPACSWHVQIQVPLSQTSPISHSLRIQKFTPPCSSVSTHTP